MVCITDTIDKWDTDKLSEVVNKKHSAKTKTKTDIVSCFPEIPSEAVDQQHL